MTARAMGLDSFPSVEESLDNAPRLFGLLGERAPGPVSRVAVAGAGGRLGKRTVEQLLLRGVEVDALIRKGVPGGSEALSAFCHKRTGRMPRVVACDLSDVFFGLGEDGFSRDASGWDVVFNAAGRTSAVEGFGGLFSANAAPALTLAKIAQTGRLVVHASTLSLFVSSTRPEGLCEEKSATDRSWFGGYAGTKAWAERVFEASGTPSFLVRFGLLTPERDFGLFSKRELFPMAMSAMKKTGGVPDDLDGRVAVDTTALDDAAREWVKLAFVEAPTEALPVHFACVEPLFVERLAKRVLSGKMTALGREQTQSAIARLSGLERILAMGAFDRENKARAAHPNIDLFQSTGAAFDMTRAIGLGMIPPKGCSDGYLDMMVSSWERGEFCDV